MNTVDRLLNDYAIFFRSGRFTIDQLQDDFKLSLNYSNKDNARYYDLNESENAIIEEGKPSIRKETFEEFITNHLKSSKSLFAIETLTAIQKIQSPGEQNALLFSLIAYLQNFLIILSHHEDPMCGEIYTYIEDSKNFIIETFSAQLELNNAVNSLSTKKTELSSFFRMIDKLKFDLNKNEVVALFILLIDSGILKYPSSNRDLSIFLDHNTMYKRETGKYDSIIESKTTISRARRRDTLDIDKKIKEIIERLKSTIIKETS